MPIIHILRGIPASGKSTLRKSMNLPYVNRDELRLLYPDYTEILISGKQSALIQELVDQKVDFVIDNTHIKHVPYYRYQEQGYEIKEHWLLTPIAECIYRDATREKIVGKSVIMKMAMDSGKYTNDPFITYLQRFKTVIFDIDGTLANCKHRQVHLQEKPKNWKLFNDLMHLDTVYKDVADLIPRFNGDHHIILVSGRESSMRKVTEQWLDDNDIYYDYLFMRGFNDYRDDPIIKQEIYETYIKPYTVVDYVFDDRLRVCERWRSLGLRCLQVQEGNF